MLLSNYISCSLPSHLCPCQDFANSFPFCYNLSDSLILQGLDVTYSKKPSQNAG